MSLFPSVKARGQVLHKAWRTHVNVCTILMYTYSYNFVAKICSGKKKYVKLEKNEKWKRLFTSGLRALKRVCYVVCAFCSMLQNGAGIRLDLLFCKLNASV